MRVRREKRLGYFSEYTRGFNRSSRGPAYHAMLRMIDSYFDDSADDRMERHCATGGFFGRAVQWDAFIIAWSQETHGLKKPFHTTDCEGGYEQFEGWPKEKRNELMAGLVSIIKGSKLAGFASIVPIQAYKAAFPNCESGDPYLLTIPHTIMNMASIADNADIGVNIWFELGGPKGFIGETFEAIKKMKWKPAQRLHALAFDTKELHPLQSADLLAREAFKHIDNIGVRPMRIPMKRMGDSNFFIAWTEDALRYLAANGGPQNLELLAHWDEYPDAPKLKWHSLWLAKRGGK